LSYPKIRVEFSKLLEKPATFDLHGHREWFECSVILVKTPMHYFRSGLEKQFVFSLSEYAFHLINYPLLPLWTLVAVCTVHNTLSQLVHPPSNVTSASSLTPFLIYETKWLPNVTGRAKHLWKNYVNQVRWSLR